MDLEMLRRESHREGHAMKTSTILLAMLLIPAVVGAGEVLTTAELLEGYALAREGQRHEAKANVYIDMATTAIALGDGARAEDLMRLARYHLAEWQKGNDRIKALLKSRGW